MSSSTTHFAGQLRLDRERYQLLDGERPVHLERQCMELLILLVERRGQLVTRDQIAARLWGESVFVDTDRNITSIVRKLRQALKDDPDNPRYVETVVGKGYRFVGPLEVVPAPSQPLPPAAATRQPTRSIPMWIRGHLAAIAVLAFVVALATWLAFRTLRSADDASLARSVAILPLANLSGDVAQDYFADGMTQELTTELAQTSQLRVIAHTSVMQYKNSQKSVAEIAKELRVDAVIEGSVLRSGDRVRVTAQLIRAPSAHALWASSYERDLRDVLSLQREIAEDVAEHVKIKLTRSLGESASSARPLDPAAHDAYLRGLVLLENVTEDRVQEAIANFNQALAKDPSYAAAYASQAYAYVVLGIYYWPPQRAMPVARAAALKALELDPNLSEAHVALASVDCYYEWDWGAAEQEAKKALTLNPSNAHAHDLLASYYGAVGRTDESLAEMERARDLAPRSSEILGDTVFWAFFARKYDLAISNGEAAIVAEPDNAFAQVFLGMAYAEKGRTEDALRHADLAMHYDGGPLIASFRANVYALAGHRREAREALREVEKQRVEHYSCAYEIGTAYVLLDQLDRGFQWLDNAYEGRSQCLFLLKVDPRLDSVRADPRYQTLLRRVGLGN